MLTIYCQYPKSDLMIKVMLKTLITLSAILNSVKNSLEVIPPKELVQDLFPPPGKPNPVQKRSKLLPTVFPFQYSVRDWLDFAYPDADRQESCGDCGVVMKSKRHRIINGEKPDYDLPWVAAMYIRSYPRFHAWHGCGGSVLGTGWILTAAHCICNTLTGCSQYVPKFQSPVKISEKYQIPWKSMRKMRAVVGHNDIDEDAIEIIGLRVLRIVQHPEYNAGKQLNLMENDIALIRVKSDYDWPKIPICLPGQIGAKMIEAFGPDVNGIQDLKVAGRGLKGESFYCKTGPLGAKMFTHCKLPFSYKGNVHETCAKIVKTPAADQPACQRYTENLQARDGDKALNDYMVDIYENKTIVSSCLATLNERQKANGWCATCIKSSYPGQLGYCGRFPTNATLEMSYPNGTDHWGVCDRSTCSTFKKHDLHVVDVQVVDPKDPRWPCTLRGLDNPREFCAGHIYRTKRKLVVMSVQENNTYSFREEEKDKLKLNTFTLGYKDSCKGDSGGPIWKDILINNVTRRAIQVGVVNRGSRVCGSKNKPAVYAKVKEFTNWILEYVPDAVMC